MPRYVLSQIAVNGYSCMYHSPHTYSQYNVSTITTLRSSLLTPIISPRNHDLPEALCPQKGSTMDVAIIQASEWRHLPELAVPMLRYLGCHLSCDKRLTTKVIRLIHAFIAKVRQIINRAIYSR